ncbi:MAG: tetratricopeptide repeat protein, partial [Acidobacteria bacterium]|nr:tetratricopeptide repeat protein [Acidobacteriota bacterium]
MYCWLRRGFFTALSILLLTGPTNADRDHALWQTTQLNHRPVVALQNEPQVSLLEPGKPVERELAGGESQSYLITLASGQFLQAIIGQGELDLTATLFGPDGRQVGQFDSRWYGPEPVCFVAEVSGSYRLAIRPFHRTATRGSYQLMVEEPRTPTPEDQTRVTALRATTEGKQLIEKGGLENFRLARGKYEEALPNWVAIGDRFAEAQTLNSLGFLSVSLGVVTKALEYLNQAQAIRKDIKDQGGEGETLNNIAFINSALGKKEQALEYYSRALPLRRIGGDRAGIAQTLGNMGLIYFSLGDTQKAVEHYNQSLPFWRGAGNLAGEANALSSLGSIYRVLGEKQLALDNLQRALQITRGANDRRGEAFSLVLISRLYYELGEREKALDLCSQAKALYGAISDRSGEALALNNLGEFTASLGENQKALEYYGQALSNWQAVNDRYNEASTLLNIGKLKYGSGENQKALDYYNQALT